MTRYAVWIPYTAWGSDLTFVEAANPEEARRIAEEEGGIAVTSPMPPAECEWHWEQADVVGPEEFNEDLDN